MKKTKIICTMGPNADDREVLKALVENGMDIARFNFSHGDHEEQKKRFDLLKSVREEMKKPLLTKERIMYWLESFKRGDIEDVEYQRRIIDTLVNSVYVYDDGDKGRKLVLTFNISGNNTLTISSSDIERTAPPNSANPNSFFFVKHCVGFVFIVEDVG